MRRDVIRFIYWPISFNERDLKRNINMILNEVVLLCQIKNAFQYIIERGVTLRNKSLDYTAYSDTESSLEKKLT